MAGSTTGKARGLDSSWRVNEDQFTPRELTAGIAALSATPDALKEDEDMTRVNWLLTLALAAGAFCAVSPISAAEKDTAFSSGLRPGDNLFSFKCRGVTGPNKDKSLCYI